MLQDYIKENDQKFFNRSAQFALILIQVGLFNEAIEELQKGDLHVEATLLAIILKELMLL